MKTSSRTFYEVHVHRGESTFAYSATEYPTREAAKDEAKRLQGLGEGAMEIHEVTVTRTSQLASVFPEAMAPRSGQRIA